MADLIVEFTRAGSSVPVEDAAVRTEVITIGSEAQSSLMASGENVVDLRAGAACWVSIGADPEAEVEGASSRFLAEGERRQFRVRAGYKVSVIAAA